MCPAGRTVLALLTNPGRVVRETVREIRSGVIRGTALVLAPAWLMMVVLLLSFCVLRWEILLLAAAAVLLCTSIVQTRPTWTSLIFMYACVNIESERGRRPRTKTPLFDLLRLPSLLCYEYVLLYMYSPRATPYEVYGTALKRIPIIAVVETIIWFCWVSWSFPTARLNGWRRRRVGP